MLLCFHFQRHGCALALFTLLAAPVLAQTPERTEAEQRAAAVALAERAVAHVHAVGRTQALADFNRPDGGFKAGEDYVFCHAADGTVIAHGGNPALVGRNMMNARDPDGKRPAEELNRLGLTEGAGWVEFRWPNPVTKRIQARIAYILKVDDQTVCGAGFFRH